MAKHRTQLFLEDEQYRVLAGMAGRENRTISDVVRELLAESLERRRASRDEKLRVLERINHNRRALQRQIGTLGYDPVAEARQELERRADFLDRREP